MTSSVLCAMDDSLNRISQGYTAQNAVDSRPIGLFAYIDTILLHLVHSAFIEASKPPV
ncbi:hypothetical protein MHI37_12130 [Paenibacillus sp. FSL H8-0548]|uniref:hypothetical protein n=1 Tax=Paenibacillus sp. FSL H8-0548 TaxID=1920422 RepID=UPI0015C386A9|nr:hypothetical protein [Paenibacillus sp. FSL H8-0548]